MANPVVVISDLMEILTLTFLELLAVIDCLPLSTAEPSILDVT